MSAAVMDEEARGFALRLEKRHRDRTGDDAEKARAAVARRTGVAAGTLENLRRRRIKGVRGWVRDALQAAIIVELKHEQQAIEHELALYGGTTGRMDASQVVEAEASLAALREILKGQAGAPAQSARRHPDAFDGEA